MSAAKKLIIGVRWTQQNDVQGSVTLDDKPPKDWLWFKTIRKKVNPSWSEWARCWRSLHNTRSMDISIYHGVYLLQHHGPKKLRPAWGWVSNLLKQGHSFGEAVEAIFHMPPGWGPLINAKNIQPTFWRSLTKFCENQNKQRQRLAQQLRYPIIMATCIMVIGFISSLNLFGESTAAQHSSATSWLSFMLWLIPISTVAYTWYFISRCQTSFFRFLELSLKSGYTEHESIDYFCNFYPKTKVSLIRERIKKGISFENACKGVWSDSITEVIQMHGHRLDAIVGVLAEMIEFDENVKGQKLITWTQALLIFMMGFMVLLMVYETILPLYESLGNFSF